MKTITAWIAAQTVLNWEADRKQGFSLYGITSRHYHSAMSMAAGDLVIHYAAGGYVTGVRYVIADGVVPLGRNSHYVKQYPWAIRTAPLAVLPRYAWSPVKPLLPQLTMVRDVGTGMYCFQTALKRIPHCDAVVFLEAVVEQLRRLREAPFTAATAIPRCWAYRQALRASGNQAALDAYNDKTIDADRFWRAVYAGRGVVPFLDWRGNVSPLVGEYLPHHGGDREAGHV